MWHDKSAEKSHAGEGKMVCGMTRVPRRVMPERGKEVCGMTGWQEKVMPERGKWYVA